MNTKINNIISHIGGVDCGEHCLFSVVGGDKVNDDLK